MSPPPHRCRQGEAKSDDGTRGKRGCEQGRGGTHGSEVHDLGRALHTDHRHRVALTAAIGHGCEVRSAAAAILCRLARPAVEGRLPGGARRQDQVRRASGRVGALQESAGQKSSEANTPVPIDV